MKTKKMSVQLQVSWTIKVMKQSRFNIESQENKYLGTHNSDTRGSVYKGNYTGSRIKGRNLLPKTPKREKHSKCN